MGNWDDSIKIYLREQAQAFVNLVVGGVKVVRHAETEFKTSTLEADAVVEVEDEETGEHSLVHLEFQSTRDPLIAERLLEYNFKAHRLHKLPVDSWVIYLREVGDVPEPPLDWKRSRGRDGLRFEYDSLNLADLPVEQLKATGEVGLRPIGILTKGGATRAEMEALVDDLGSREEYGLLALSRLFAGLVFKQAEEQEWLERIFAMFNDLFAETPTYQRLVRQGREQGLQEGLQQGREQGKQEGLQKAVLDIIKVKFPSLSPLARQKVPKETKSDALNLLLKVVVIAPDEAAVRVLLESLAA